MCTLNLMCVAACTETCEHVCVRLHIHPNLHTYSLHVCVCVCVCVPATLNGRVLCFRVCQFHFALYD